MKINKKKIVDNVSNNKTVCFSVFIIIFVFCICLFPLINKATHSVYNSVVSVSDNEAILFVTCPTDADVLEELTCQIKLGTNLPMTIHGFSTKLSSTNSLTFKEFKYSDDTSWSKYGEVNYIGSDGLVLTTDGASDEQIIGEIVYTVSENIDITKDLIIYFKDTVITDNNGTEKEISDIEISVYVSSSIANTLENITLSNGSLNETFDKNKNEYTAVVNSDSVVISAVATDERAFISGDTGKVSLEYGENVFEIKVFSENGEEPNVYKLTITRVDEDNDYNLSFADDLDVDNESKYIKSISADTSVSVLLEKINVVNGEGEIYNSNNVKKEGNSVLVTGDVLKTYSKSGLQDVYTISVLGDSNGDGKVGTLDLVQIRKHIVGYVNDDGSIYEKTGVYLLALDMNGDGKINTVDVYRIRKIVAGVKE